MNRPTLLIATLLFVLAGNALAQEQKPTKIDKLVSKVDPAFVYVPQMEAIASVQSGGCMEGIAFVVKKTGMTSPGLHKQINQQLGALAASHWTLIDFDSEGLSGSAAQIVPLVCEQPDKPEQAKEFVYQLIFQQQDGTESGFEPYIDRSVCETDGQALASAREKYKSYRCSATRLHAESVLPELGIEA